jgi:hypothetical protein
LLLSGTTMRRLKSTQGHTNGTMLNMGLNFNWFCVGYLLYQRMSH